ncbi:UNVERIFIED_CONTAM: hypothetical protein K2H54_014487 [Gekko kuhli]
MSHFSELRSPANELRPSCSPMIAGLRRCPSWLVCMFCLGSNSVSFLYSPLAPVVPSSFGLGKSLKQRRTIAAGIFVMMLLLCHYLHLVTSWAEAGKYPQPNYPSASEQN